MTIFNSPRALKLMAKQAKQRADYQVKADADQRVRAATGGQRQSGSVMGGGTSINTRSSWATDTPSAQARAAEVKAVEVRSQQQEHAKQQQIESTWETCKAFRAFHIETDPDEKGQRLLEYAHARGIEQKGACGFRSKAASARAVQEVFHDVRILRAFDFEDKRIELDRVEQATCHLHGVTITPECGRFDC